MKRIYILVGCISLLLTANITGMSYEYCNEEDPEIVDTTGDVSGYFGHQYRWLIFQQIDITSASFFEDLAEPEFLQLILEIKNYRPSIFLTMYTVNFTLNNTRYSTIFMTRFGGSYVRSILMKVESGVATPDYGTAELQGNQIHFRIQKEVLGYPSSGDVCSETKVWTVVSIGGLILSWDDVAPNTGWGEDYIIQY
ncbi:MAG: hypothetical protein ACOC80_07745 [Petrotogales bacterium]